VKSSQIRPEYSAQGTNTLPNPMLIQAIRAVKELSPLICHVADQGCGRLRHLRQLLKAFKRITLVDTPLQLGRRMRIDGTIQTIPEYIWGLSRSERKRICIMATTEFEAAELKLDAVFSICTFDVVPKSTRAEMARAAHRNLKEKGIYVVIVPRNDASITHRCTDDNRYQDGHIFLHHGIATFYVNFRDHVPLIRFLERLGFRLLYDMSNYRQVCLILAKIPNAR